MTTLEAVKAADMKPAEAVELFRISAKLGRTGLEIGPGSSRLVLVLSHG
jgi:hypothetical protein